MAASQAASERSLGSDASKGARFCNSTMKSSDNREMERLLRRYARPGGEALRGLEEQNEDAFKGESALHLDADELNAYAEGALPEGARSRYFAHLADCDSCRKLVTELTLAANLADEGKARVAAIGTPPSKSWRDWLATIFSVPVLRYGVPALALFAIIVVAFVATRTQREASFVAQNDKAERNSPQEVGASANTSAPATTANTGVENHSNSNISSTAPTVDEQNAGGQIVPSATPLPPKSPQIVTDEPTGTLADATRPAQPPANKPAERPGIFGARGRSVEETERTVATTSEPQPPPPAATDSAANVEAGRDRREDQKKEKTTAKDNDEVAPAASASGGALSNEVRINKQRPATGSTIAARPVQELPARKSAGPAKNEDDRPGAKEDRSSETRSISGRKFRRQGSAWVDTAYKSSLSTTNVARGSEQYRSLVADEPALRTITQQLGGEVIVVWRSRAYRFY